MSRRLRRHGQPAAVATAERASGTVLLAEDDQQLTA
jgi:hypothetical protein